jgi:hypothetical protein
VVFYFDMTSGEFSGSGIPQDELAPNLAMIWEHEEFEPQHYSTLTPDPEATVDMRLWAKLFAQMKAFDQWGEISAYGQLPDQDIVIGFPGDGVWVGDGPDVWMRASFNQFTTDEDQIVGRRGFTLEFDLTRPGYVRAFEGVVSHAEHLKPHDLLAESELKEPAQEGLYMAKNGSSVGYRFAEYAVSQSTAEKLSELLAQANLAEENVLEDRWKTGLKLMDPSVGEAVHRHYILRKSLVRSPEEAFKPTEWKWGYMPSQIGLADTNIGIYADHWDKLETFAPPGGYPCDGTIIFEFLETVDKTKGEWIKATWDKEQLPDNFEPMFDDPTSLETVSPAEVIAYMPAEIKEKISTWAQESLFWRRNWVDTTIHSIDNVIDMTEEEFAERKKKHDEKGKHFYWGMHRSLRSSINTALHNADRPYEEWTAQYDQIAQDYSDFYSAYAEVIQQFPHEERPMGPSLWKSETERDELNKKVFRAYQKMAELPEDPPEESVKYLDDIDLL